MKHKVILYLLLPLLAIAGCGRDPFSGTSPDAVVTEGKVKARVNLRTSEFTVVETRALSQAQEDAWEKVWVAQFRGEDPETATLIGVVSDYTSTTGELVVELEAGDNNIVYFITNVDTNPFLNEDGEVVSTLAEFKSTVYTPPERSYNNGLYDNNFVMVGVWKGSLTSANPDVNSMLVYVDRLAAKLNVVINAQQAISEYFQTPSMIIDSMQLCNLPAYVSYVEGGKVIADAAEVVNTSAEAFPEDETVAVKTYRNAEPYYLLENLQGVHTPAQEGEQFKNEAARLAGIKDVATYLKLYGHMNDGRNSGPVVYTIYLGADVYKDFNVRRNRNYTLTVNIDGAGIVTSDMRVDNDDVTTIELKMLNGIGRGTSRASETRPADSDDENWGDRTPVKEGVDKLKSQDYLYVDLGKDKPNATWQFSISTDQEGWNPTVSILRPVAGWVPDGSAPVWRGDDEWEVVAPGDELPNGARFRINLGVNTKPVVRKVTFKYWNSADASSPRMERLWYVQQAANPIFNIAQYNYIPSPAGTYGVAVRAADNISWRVKSSTADLTVVGIAGSDGVIKTGSDDYIRGHGTVVFSVDENTKLPYRDRQAVVVSVWVGDTATPNESDVADRTAYVLQMASTKAFTDSKSAATKYVYDYSSDPLFETMVLVPNYTVEWAVNMVGEGVNYERDKRLVDASSTVDGRFNTWQIYSKMDLEAGKIAPASLDAPPIFTPAGLTVMMNDNWQQITEDNYQQRLVWYLPARYQGLLDATSMMLRPSGIVSGFYGTFWTSTGPDTEGKLSTDPKYSAYFAGMSVDVSGTFSPLSKVRAIKDKNTSSVDKTYPYMYQDQNGNPIVVTREVDNGVVRGYNQKYTDETYVLGAPTRYYRNPNGTWGFAIDATGPASPYAGYLSTRFQVAKDDAPMKPNTTTETGNWTMATGFTTNQAVAYQQTGCAAYREGGHDDWRVPTELEMRIILLLGGGTATPKGYVPELQAGSEVGSFSTVPGYTYIGNTGTGVWSYWTNRNYTDATRAQYIGASASYGSGVVGTAADKKSLYRVRCVRDLEKYVPPKD